MSFCRQGKVVEIVLNFDGISGNRAKKKFSLQRDGQLYQTTQFTQLEARYRLRAVPLLLENPRGKTKTILEGLVQVASTSGEAARRRVRLPSGTRATRGFAARTSDSRFELSVVAFFSQIFEQKRN